MNVCGWTQSNERLRIAIINEINADIFSLNETHLSENNVINVPGYTWKGFNRLLIHRDAPKASGGVGFLIKDSLLQEYSCDIVDKTRDGILCIKLVSKSTDYSVLFITCYLPPENSVWGRDSQEFLSHVLSSVYINNDCDAVFVCGDFNARIGDIDELSEFDDIDIVKRHVIDNTVNQHGHSFIEFLNEAKMCILNGRFGEDDNNFTSVSTRGKAAVDYICVPHETMEQCVNFKVRTARSIIGDGNLVGLLGDRSKAPDHSALIAEFRTSHINTGYDTDEAGVNCERPRYKLKQTPRDFLSSDLSKLALQTLILKIESSRETQVAIDTHYDDLCNVIITEMDKCIPRFETGRKARRRFKSHKPYWNEELTDLWNAMHDREKQFLNFNGRSSIKTQLRMEFLSSHKRFDKRLRQYERAYKRSVCDDIENMTSENPNEFWEKIKKIGPRKYSKVPMETIDENGEIVTDETLVLNR